jgi:hypothetical protein
VSGLLLLIGMIMLQVCQWIIYVSGLLLLITIADRYVAGASVDYLCEDTYVSARITV